MVIHVFKNEYTLSGFYEVKVMVNYLKSCEN